MWSYFNSSKQKWYTISVVIFRLQLFYIFCTDNYHGTKRNLFYCIVWKKCQEGYWPQHIVRSLLSINLKHQPKNFFVVICNNFISTRLNFDSIQTLPFLQNNCLWKSRYIGSVSNFEDVIKTNKDRLGP